MDVVNEKKQILNNWCTQKNESEFVVGPSPIGYIDSVSNNKSYGTFQIIIGDRGNLYKECFLHIDRLLIELDRRFKLTKLQECFLVLFEPEYLISRKDEVMRSSYGRQELEYIGTKYMTLSGFNMDQCRREWKTIKISLSEFAFVNH